MRRQNFQLTKDPETPAARVLLRDDELDALGVQRPAEIDLRLLTSRFQSQGLSFAEAQNRAVALQDKMRAPRRSPTVATAPPHTLRLPVVNPPDPPSEPDRMHQLTQHFVERGFAFEDAQEHALRKMSDPDFNPDRRPEYMSEPARQEYANTIAELTALLQPAGAPGRDSLIQKLGNGNLLATLTAIANGYIQNLSVCQTWAQRIVGSRTVSGALTYEAARARAETLTEELMRVSDRTPNRLSTGVIVPQIASASAHRAPPSAGPLQSGGLPVDQSAAQRAAMRETDAVTASWWRARAFASAARGAR